MNKEIKLGDTAKDSITGYEGVVVCVSKWLHGCTRITLQPREMDGDGKIKEQCTFDEPQLILIPHKTEKSTSGTGGWAPGPVQKQTPLRN